jgi:hypothetical protein
VVCNAETSSLAMLGPGGVAKVWHVAQPVSQKGLIERGFVLARLNGKDTLSLAVQSNSRMRNTQSSKHPGSHSSCGGLCPTHNGRQAAKRRLEWRAPGNSHSDQHIPLLMPAKPRP